MVICPTTFLLSSVVEISVCLFWVWVLLVWVQLECFVCSLFFCYTFEYHKDIIKCDSKHKSSGFGFQKNTREFS